MTDFLTDSFKIYIYNFIRKTILVNLNIIEYDKILIILENLINYIAIKFDFESDALTFEHQLKQNNNSDICSIFNLLFPYIDDENNSYNLHKQIINISDISIKKKDAKYFMEKDNSVDYDFNPYIISNIQYNRHITNPSYLKEYTKKYNNNINYQVDEDLYYDMTKHKNKYFIEYELSIADILNNFYLLILSINQVSNKLYVNWIDIKPIIDYKSSNLYKNTYKYNEQLDQFIHKDSDKYNYDYMIPYNVTFPDKILLKSNYKGLDIGDIYNIIHHELYFNIKEIKWLIYDLPLDNHNYKNIYNYWNLFCDIFTNIEYYIINNIDYELVKEYDKFNWLFIKDDICKKIKNDTVIQRLVYNILYYLQRKYSKQYDLKVSEYIMLKIKFKNKSPSNDDVDKILDALEEVSTNYEIDENDIIKSWNSLTLYFLYEYIKEAIGEFRKTWYGYNIIEKKQPRPITNPMYVNLDIIEYNLTYKNIYNYAKYILFYVFNINESDTDVENLFYYKYYIWANLGGYYITNIDTNEDIITIDKSLNYMKNKFIDIFNCPYNNSGFSISNIITEYYFKSYKLQKNNIEDINKHIFKEIKANIIDISFECLTIRGLLSEFIPNKNCTDNKIKNINLQKELANIFNETNINKYKNCFYYLTGKQYKDLPLVKDLDYFKFLHKKSQWYLLYAMHWISQISFFHRYINNRIIYLTGSTGQGKSTQVPKLLLYALKMIDFNTKGRVVSTQPRITPTVSNAKNIANELGVPITSFSHTQNKEIKTFLNYVQYKTLKDYHLDSKSQTFLREMTDGTLISDLIKNPLLKTLIQKDKDNPYDNNYNFGLDNLYDIVIIDESHEHNKNMDIILTLIKYAIHWNNSLKLIIVSATMINDEHIYRRYYKDINDNMSYPLNFFNSSCQYIYDTISYTLDRGTVDRRVHISPPGETTRFIITDIYLKDDTNTYLEAEEKGMKKLLEIVNTTSDGDILFFTIGYKEIVKLVTEFNKLTPSNVIALPFYGELTEEWKLIAENSHTVNKLDINKNEIFKEIKLKNSASKVSINTYNRAIIVATNVAEASITITNLRYVIDTGYYNSVKYDSILKITNVQNTPISEVSRVQRRGRIGRVANGTIYYMYKFEARLNIKTSFNICNDNILYDIFKLLRRDCQEKLLIDDKYNIYNISYKNSITNITIPISDDNNLIINNLTRVLIDYNDTFKILSSKKYIKENNIDKFHNIDTWKAIYNMMSYQYLYHFLDGKTKINYIYLGDDHLCNYHISISIGIQTRDILYLPPIRYLSGYNIATLTDFYGMFWIIHPAEEIIIRHSLTGHINLEPGYIDETFFKKIYSYISTLYYSNMLTINDYSLNCNINLNNSSDIHNYTTYFYNNLYALYSSYILKNDEDTNNTNDFFKKTKFADMLLSIMEKVELDKNTRDENLKLSYMIVIIYGFILGIENEIIQVVSALLAFDINPIMLIPTNLNAEGKSKFVLKNNPLTYFKDKFGDVILYYNIFKKFTSNINLSKKENKIDSINYDDVIKTYLEYKTKMIANINNNKNILNNVNFKSNFSFSDLELMQKIDQKGNLHELVGKKEYSIAKSDLSDRDFNSLNIDFIKKIASEYYLDSNTVISMIKKYNMLYNTFNIEKKYFQWFKDNIKINKEILVTDNILKSFLYGFIENLSLYVDKKLINLFNNNEIFVKDIIPNMLSNTTILLDKFVCYFSVNKFNVAININNINIDWALELVPSIANNDLIKNNLHYTHNVINSKFYKT